MSKYSERLSAVRNNPLLMINVALDEMESQLQGRGDFDVPDAGNPFVFLLEASTLNTTMGIDEGEALLRRLYASMANTEEELYLHMSDDDYIGRFASPAWTTFEVYLSKSELLARARPVGTQGVRQLIIPRLSEFTVADTTFTMQYPIALRVMAHGGLQIVYLTDDVSPIQTLDTNMVEWNQIRLDGDELLVLRIPVGQFKVTTFTETLNNAAGFDTDYGFEDRFYYARVYLSDNTGQWTEIRTTHTDQVYNYMTPTAVLQVNGNVLNVNIPSIYFSLGDMDGEVRIDIYTTKGEIDIDPGSYQPSQFTYNLVSIDDDVTYTSPLQNFTRFSILNPNHVKGGSGAIRFEELRDRVIENTLGTSRIPITGAQLETELSSRGYTVVTNIDNITNRQFLATRRLTGPAYDLVTGDIGCMMGQLQVVTEVIATSEHVIDNGPRVTILPSMLYGYNGGVVTPLLDGEINTLQNMDSETLVRTINTNRYMYSPLHYVLDTTNNAFDVRPYYMDQPSIIRKLFVDENNTAQMQVGISEYSIERIDGGYRVFAKLQSGSGWKNLDDENAIVQMGYRPMGENSYASVNGVQIGIEDNERVYQFDILTRFDINEGHGLYTTNLSMFDLFQYNYATRLEEDFDFTFIIGNSISVGYEPTQMDTLVQRHLLPNDFMVASRERLVLRLGYDLTRLWRRNRSLISESSYQRYENNVPAYYEETVYERDDTGTVIIDVDNEGNLIYQILHNKGDPVLDGNGEPVYLHLAGDPVLDGNGEPILVDGRKILREFTMLLMDGVYYFVSDSQALSYRDSVPMQIVRWIQNDLDLLERRLLEQSDIYFYPTATIGDAEAIVRSSQRSTVALNQSFFVNYYMSETAYQNASLREALERSTRETVNEMLGYKTVALADITTRLREEAGEDIINLEAGGIGGENDFSVITLTDDSTRMSLRKRLVILANQLLAVQDDIDIEFRRHLLASQQ